MATAILRPSNGLFPASTNVSAYPAYAKMPGHAPAASVVSTSTVATDGSVTFTSLADQTQYVAYALVSGQHRYLDFATFPATDSVPDAVIEAPASWANQTGFNFTVGGTHYVMPADQELVKIDEWGNLLMGKNLLGDASQGTLQKQIFDFAWMQKHLRLAVRNMTLTEVSDPCDINLRRAGEGYPWAQPNAAEGTNANLTGVGAGSLVGQVRGTAFATKLLKKGTATFTIGSNQVTITGADPLWVGLNIWAVPLPGGVVGAAPGLSTPGSAVINDVTGDVLTLSANAIAPGGVAEFAIGGDQTTQGASAVESGAVINFQCAEMPRDLSGAQDFGVGMGMRWNNARNGTQANTNVMSLTHEGHLLVGQGSVDGGDTGDILQVRGWVGENEVQTISGTPTAGTFTLDCPMVNLPLNGYVPFVTTAPIAYNASAAAVQTALEAVYGAGNVTVTGGPIGTATLTITWVGALARTNIPTKLQKNTAGLTGSLTVGWVINGAPSDAGRRLLFLRRTNLTPTVDYLTVQDGAGLNILRLMSDGGFQHTGKVGFNGVTPVVRQTLGAAATDAASTQTLANNIRTALINLGLGQT